MSLIRKEHKRKQRRLYRVRNAVKTAGLPRVCVTRSLNQIYAQLIDDTVSKTVASASSLTLKKKGAKKVVARAVGVELARLAQGLGIKKVCFDRGALLYHGRVKELAEGLREGGLQV